jgi:hypothetical protein
MLTALGDAEHGSRQHRIGLRRAIGRQHSRPGRTDGIEDAGQEIQHLDVDSDHGPAAEVAQEMRQFLQRIRDRAAIVTIGAVETFAGMRVHEIEPA